MGEAGGGVPGDNKPQNNAEVDANTGSDGSIDRAAQGHQMQQSGKFGRGFQPVGVRGGNMDIAGGGSGKTENEPAVRRKADRKRPSEDSLLPKKLTREGNPIVRSKCLAAGTTFRTFMERNRQPSSGSRVPYRKRFKTSKDAGRVKKYNNYLLAVMGEDVGADDAEEDTEKLPAKSEKSDTQEQPPTKPAACEGVKSTASSPSCSTHNGDSRMLGKRQGTECNNGSAKETGVAHDRRWPTKRMRLLAPSFAVDETVEWYEILNKLQSPKGCDSRTLRNVLDESIAAAKDDAEAERKLKNAKEILRTDPEAAWKLVEETKNAQNLMFLARNRAPVMEKPKESQKPDFQTGNTFSRVVKNVIRSPERQEKGCSDVKSSSERSTGSGERSWQEMLKLVVEEPSMSENRFDELIGHALTRARREGANQDAVAVMENLLACQSLSLSARLQGAKEILERHSKPDNEEWAAQSAGSKGTQDQKSEGPASSADEPTGFEREILLLGWRKEIAIESVDGKNALVTYYVNKATNQRCRTLEEVKQAVEAKEREKPAEPVQHSTPTVSQQGPMPMEGVVPAQRTQSPLFSSPRAPRTIPESLTLASQLAGREGSASLNLRSPAAVTALSHESAPQVQHNVQSQARQEGGGVLNLAPGTRLVNSSGQVIQLVGQTGGGQPVRLQNQTILRAAQVQRIPPGAVLLRPGGVQRNNNRNIVQMDQGRKGPIVVLANRQTLHSTDGQSLRNAFARPTHQQHQPSQLPPSVHFSEPINVHRAIQQGAVIGARNTSLGQDQSSTIQLMGEAVRKANQQPTLTGLRTPQHSARQQGGQEQLNPYIMKYNGQDQLVMLTPSQISNMMNSSQQRQHQQQPPQQPPQQQVFNQSRATIIQTGKDHLLVLPSASVAQGGGKQGLLLKQGLGGVRFEQRPGVNQVGDAKSVQGIASCSPKDVRQRTVGGNVFAGNGGITPQQIITLSNQRGRLGGSNPSTSGAQHVLRPVGMGREKDHPVIDLTDAALNAVSQHQSGPGDDKMGASMQKHVTSLQELHNRASGPMDRHQLIHEALLQGMEGGSRKPSAPVQRPDAGQGKTMLLTPDRQVVVPLGDSAGDLSKLLSRGTLEGLDMQQINGIPVLVQLPNNGQEDKGDQKEMQHNGEGMEEGCHQSVDDPPTGNGVTERLENPPASPDMMNGGNQVRWKCTLRSKPTPQRPDQELFTVVGWVSPGLYQKLPDSMTVAEFEDRLQLDSGPTEEIINLHLDDETSEKGRHALKRLSEMRLAAVVHLPDFDFIFDAHPNREDISLRGLVKIRKDDEREAGEEAENNME